MLNLIHHLRRKPLSVRRHVAVTAAAAVTLAIALLWLVSLLATGGASLASSPAASQADDGGPFSVIGAAVSSLFSDTRDAVRELREGLAP